MVAQSKHFEENRQIIVGNFKAHIDYLMHYLSYEISCKPERNILNTLKFWKHCHTNKMTFFQTRLFSQSVLFQVTWKSLVNKSQKVPTAGREMKSSMFMIRIISIINKLDLDSCIKIAFI